MAQADFTTTPPIRVVGPKPRMTIYYALLIIALGAMLLACLFMYLEIRRFGGFGAVTGRVAKAEIAAPASFTDRSNIGNDFASLKAWDGNRGEAVVPPGRERVAVRLLCNLSIA